MRKLKYLLLIGLIALTMGLAGCADDGTNGLSAYEIAFAADPTIGTEAEWLASLQPTATTAADSESCAVCHSDIEATHAATGVPTISDASGIVDGAGDYVITFNLAVDGFPTNQGYQLYRAYVTDSDPTLDDADSMNATTTNQRTTLASLSTPATALPAEVSVASTAAGAFTVTIDSTVVRDDAAYTVILRDLETAISWGDKEPGFVVINGTSPLRDLVTDDGVSAGCAACHGASASSLFDHYLTKGNECQACHAIYSRASDSYYKDATGTWVNGGSVPGSNFTEYIHGIHNSHSMPAGEYYRSSTTLWSVGYPSAMRNCATCHVTPAQLDAAVTAPVSYYLCMTCHQSWDGFVHGHDSTADDLPATWSAGDKIFSASNFHRGSDVTTDCMGCHGAIASLDEAADFHNDFQGEDAHYNSFYRGEDISFANNNDVTFEVTGVTSDGSAVSFTWEASKLGAAVNPCNTDIATGPTYQVLGAYLAYAKGDDWVNEFVGTSPGQPASARNLFTSLTTTCAANVATTTGLVLDPEALAYADTVLLAIGGKPLDRLSTAGTEYFVREVSPTYAFDPADGTAVAARRNAVDNDKCLGCHQGSLYQHGGDRVDNEQLCVICHNPSAADKNNRLDRFQIVNADGTVNTDATYDGKNNETYDMRVMIHAIHGISKRENPWTVYRSRGIYAFANPETALPTGWPADGMTIYGSTNDSTIAHNWVVVHYPKPVNDCMACHNDEAYEAADQTKAVALTVDPGTDYADQSDDIVIGPTAAACLACHANAPARSHADGFGYRANVTKDAMLQLAE
jgi:OmcA/MtrC family decaheme c-type cytochrome